MAQDRNFTMIRALKGDIFMAANRPQDAINAYTEAMNAAPSAIMINRLASAQLRAHDLDGATKTLTDWLAKNPDDLSAMEQMAEIQIGREKLPEAVQYLQAILKIKPHNPVALNNLAWVYQQQGDPRAQDLGRQAYILSPGAQTADTLGWIMTTAGKADIGVALLRQASNEAVNDPRVQYHFAVALKDTGKKDEAIKLLTGVVANKAEFKEKALAQQLLDQLQKGS
jgi:predicted Zn-dependent protease